MTSASGSPEERGWLLRPPAPGTAEFIVRIGEGAELTSEVRQALDQLMDALSGGDTAGFAGQCASWYDSEPCYTQLVQCIGRFPGCSSDLVICQITTGPCKGIPGLG